MKLDPELVRAILLQVEATPANRWAGVLQVDGYDEDTILEHIVLLHDAGYIEAAIQKSLSGGSRYLLANGKALTWSGHQFLANARNETIWNRAMKMIREKGATVSIDILVAILTQKAKEQFGVE